MESTQRIPILRLICRSAAQNASYQKVFSALWSAAHAKDKLCSQPLFASSVDGSDEATIHAISAEKHLYEKSKFEMEKYASLLKTKEFGLPILLARTVHSTQVSMRELLCNHVQQGFAFLTDLQTSGIGRGSNIWDSPEGSLAVSFSCVIPISKGATLPFLQYLVTLSIVESIKSRPGLHDADVRIKWPNDVYGQGLKIGGILCQTDTFAGNFRVTIGFGMNVSNEKPTISLNHVLSPYESSPISREELLAVFFNHFEANYEQFLLEGFTPFFDRYTHHWMHTGQVVTLIEENREVNVTVCGLTPSGCLQAKVRKTYD
eukprot:TRINITY_DN1293_c0_g2_i4.p1 TRINITY_DN1293_c0_g2~~TRINITY_DN1293_c0_g2_i4.p1  ORF type:complete len:318 (+),score=63.64 TRINITY_DN1293_c0_g2_i4:144-1097(+)